MKRHLIDRSTTGDAARRMRAFLAIDRAGRPSHATLLLQRRPVLAPAPVRQFLRIARGRTA